MMKTVYFNFSVLPNLAFCNDLNQEMLKKNSN